VKIWVRAKAMKSLRAMKSLSVQAKAMKSLRAIYFFHIGAGKYFFFDIHIGADKFFFDMRAV